MLVRTLLQVLSTTMFRNPLSGVLNSFSDGVSTIYKLYSLGSSFGFKLNFSSRSRRCGKPGCMGYKNATETQLRVQTEQCLKSGGEDVEEVDLLPRKELTDQKLTTDTFAQVLNHIYVLRKTVPKNGRAVLVFRHKCGCPYAKLERWDAEMPSHEQKRIIAAAEEPSHDENKWKLDDRVIASVEKLLIVSDLLEEEARLGNDHLRKAVEEFFESKNV